MPSRVLRTYSGWKSVPSLVRASTTIPATSPGGHVTRKTESQVTSNCTPLSDASTTCRPSRSTTLSPSIVPLPGSTAPSTRRPPMRCTSRMRFSSGRSSIPAPVVVTRKASATSSTRSTRMSKGHSTAAVAALEERTTAGNASHIPIVSLLLTATRAHARLPLGVPTPPAMEDIAGNVSGRAEPRRGRTSYHADGRRAGSPALRDMRFAGAPSRPSLLPPSTQRPPTRHSGKRASLETRGFPGFEVNDRIARKGRPRSADSPLRMGSPDVTAPRQILVFGVGFAFRRRTSLQLENLALGQRLALLQRLVRRPRLRRRNRAFGYRETRAAACSSDSAYAVGLPRVDSERRRWGRVTHASTGIYLGGHYAQGRELTRGVGGG